MNRKPIFDAVRELLARRFSQAQVDRLNAAIDEAEALPAAPMPPSLGAAGLDLIKTFEGCGKRLADGSYEAYPDPGTGGPPWTIGWGSTGEGIAQGVMWTQGECDQRLEADLQRYVHEVSEVIGDAPTTQNQFDALVSFHYNTGAIATATLTKLHKRGKFAAAAKEFGRWVHAGGTVLPGLVRRRAAEAQLYAKP